MFAEQRVAALKDIRDMMGFDPGDGNGNLGAYLEIGPHAHIQVIYPKSAVTGAKFSVF